MVRIHTTPSGRAMFQLGVAGGLAFSYGLPGFWSEALFDDISDAAEQEDLDQIGRIRRSVAARLGPDEPPPAGRGRHWEAGPLQMLAVLSEVRTAREEGDAVRFSLMAGFLVRSPVGRVGAGDSIQARLLQGRGGGRPRPKPGDGQILGERGVD